MIDLNSLQLLGQIEPGSVALDRDIKGRPLLRFRIRSLAQHAAPEVAAAVSSTCRAAADCADPEGCAAALGINPEAQNSVLCLAMLRDSSARTINNLRAHNEEPSAASRAAASGASARGAAASGAAARGAAARAGRSGQPQGCTAPLQAIVRRLHQGSASGIMAGDAAGWSGEVSDMSQEELNLRRHFDFARVNLHDFFEEKVFSDIAWQQVNNSIRKQERDFAPGVRAEATAAVSASAMSIAAPAQGSTGLNPSPAIGTGGCAAASAGGFSEGILDQWDLYLSSDEICRSVTQAVAWAATPAAARALSNICYKAIIWHSNGNSLSIIYRIIRQSMALPVVLVGNLNREDAIMATRSTDTVIEVKRMAFYHLTPDRSGAA